MSDYKVPHLFSGVDNLVMGHSIEVDEVRSIRISRSQAQWDALRATVDQRLERWAKAGPEERATLPKVLTASGDGGGTQSLTIKRLVEHGLYRRPDVYLFADTQYESVEVYDAQRKMHGPGNDATSVPIISATTGDLYYDQTVLRAQGGKSGIDSRFAALPYYTMAPEDMKVGMTKRQCTSEYKIEVVRKVIRALMGLGKGERFPKFGIPYVEYWIGISVDEIRRAKTATDQWQSIEHPLLDLRMTRDDCRAWTDKHGYNQPPRSACIGCPLRSNAEWRDMRDNQPLEFASAVKFDTLIRKSKGMERPSFLHKDCVPLDEVDFDQGGTGQEDMFAGCGTGWCGT